MIETPYLLFLGDVPDMLAAKVAIGIRDWRPENAVGQISLPGCGADLGLTEMSLQEGLDAGAKTLVVGVANRGGVISDTPFDRAVLTNHTTSPTVTLDNLHFGTTPEPASGLLLIVGIMLMTQRMPKEDGRR